MQRARGCRTMKNRILTLHASWSGRRTHSIGVKLYPKVSNYTRAATTASSKADIATTARSAAEAFTVPGGDGGGGEVR